MINQIIPKCVREYVPLQQGLRHTHYVVCNHCLTGQRVCSITTRIKTSKLDEGISVE